MQLSSCALPQDLRSEALPNPYANPVPRAVQPLRKARNRMDTLKI